MDANWSANINSDRIRDLLPDALSDNVFSYSDMLNIFQATAYEGFSSSELDDLQYIFSQDVFENDYVKTITQNIIFPNEGNRYWWGGVKEASDIVTLGDVGAGTTEVQANLYIDKWFLGKDLPMPISGGDTANPAATSGKYDYGTITGPLFSDGITEFDVNQGSAGTCYLIASMESIAAIDPGIIEQAFIVNPNGTYGVKFYFDGEPVYTTVNNDIPVNSWGYINYAGNPNDDLSGEAWVSLMEKAYVQANAQVNLKYSYEWSDEWTAEYRNSYQFMEGGLAYTLGQITGDTYDLYSYGNWSWSGDYKTLTNESDPSKIKQELITALEDGGIGWLGSWGASFRLDDQVFTYERGGAKRELIAGHAHALHGYDAETDTFLISNPWSQSSAYSSYNTTFQLPLEFFWTSHFKPLIAITNPSADPVSYTYTINPGPGSEDRIVYEGDDIQFVVERDTSGTKSTVYLSTSHQTTSSGDIIELSKLPVVFSAGETTKTVSISTLADELSEGDETFALNFYSSLYTTAPDISYEITLKDNSSGFDYALSVSGANGDGNFIEGSDVVVTVTRDGSGSASTVYLSASGASASADDFEALNYHAVEFSSKETTKKVTISTFSDEKVEGEETFSLELFANPGGAEPLATTVVSIADAWDPEYNYIIYSNASLESSAIEEGGEITFTVIRSGAGASSTVYAKPFYNNAMANDLVDIGNLELHFSKNELQKVFTIDIAEDLWLETTESFGFKVYNSASSTTAMSQGVAYIKDKVFDEYEYTLSAGDAQSLSVNEGSNLSLEIARSGTGSVSEVFLSTRHGTTNSEDFSSITRQKVVFNQKDSLKTVQIETFSDDVADDEFFWVDLYLNENDPEPAHSEKVTLNDVSQLQSYEYEVSSAEVSEGDVASFTVTRDGSGEASTVWVATTEYTADGTDYASLGLTGITFSAKETTKTVTIQTYLDQTDEGSEPEIFWLDLFHSEADYFSGTYAAYGTGYINDVSAPDEADFTYEISSQSGNSVVEGDVETFVITRSGSGSASTVYVSTIDGSADAGDYGAISLQKIDFNAKETVKTVDVKTYSDTLSEEGEYFYLVLFDTLEATYSGDYAVWDHTYIEDNSAPADVTYTYSVNDVSVAEGETATFTVTRDSAETASAIYVNTSDYTADQSDLKAVSAQKVSFSEGELTKTVSVQTYTDSASEGDEFYYLDVFTSEADALDGWNYVAWGQGTITDADSASEVAYSYSVDSVSVVEGETATFTITRDGSETASQVYVNTSQYSADAYDMNSLYAYKVSFGIGETSKTVSVETYSDSIEEGDEYFYFDVFASEVDALDGWDYIAWGEGTIIEGDGASGGSYTYSVDSVSVVEGETATFTITRDAGATASSVYVNTSVYSADAEDMTVLSAYEVNFSAGELSKTVSVQTYADAVEEGDEYYYLDVFASEADALTGWDYIAWGNGTIVDGEIEIDVSYNYSVEGATVTEGETASFTITRDGSSTASTIYVNTTPYTADAADMNILTAKPVTFEVGESTKTVTVQTFGDGLVEGTETFYLDVFASEETALGGSEFIAWGSGSIEDASGSVDVVYDYVVDNSDVTEGETAVFTITRDGSSTSSTVYVNTSAYLLDASDMSLLSAEPVIFEIGETSKTVSITTYDDGVEEGLQTYYLDVYATEADALQGSGYIAWGKGTIADGSSISPDENTDDTVDLSYTYAVSNADVIEGETAVFTITRDGSSTSSTVYVSTSAYLFDASDMSLLTAEPVIFEIGETSKTVSITTYDDGVEEGLQTYYLDVYATEADALQGSGYIAWGKGTIADGSSISPDENTDDTVDLSYTYAVSNTDVTEGETAVFTITRDGSTTSSTVYVSTSAYLLDGSDMSLLSAQPITFEIGETSKTVSITTYDDGVEEGLQTYYLDVYATEAAALQGSGYIAWGKGTIEDGSSTSAFASVSQTPALSANSFEVFNTSAAYTARADSLRPEASAAGATDTDSAGGLSGSAAPEVLVESVEADPINTFYGHNGKGFQNAYAFAALKGDGTVTVWGDPDNGGDATTVSGSLVDVSAIYATHKAFAALNGDGSVVVWGNPNAGGEAGSLSAALDGETNVTAIASTQSAFAALREDGSVIAWGSPGAGGTYPDGQSLSDVVEIYSNLNAFAALTSEGKIVSWGQPTFGGDQNDIPFDPEAEFTSIYSTASAFAAIRADGSVYTWGNASDGGDSTTVAGLLSGLVDVTSISATTSAFAAVKADGSVVTWGNFASGADSSKVAANLDGRVDVIDVFSTDYAFAALRSDGSVVTWGNPLLGGDSSSVSDALDGSNPVEAIYSNSTAFVALHRDETLTAWGLPGHGGDMSSVTDHFTSGKTIAAIEASQTGFAALFEDGSFVTWGDFADDDRARIETLTENVTATSLSANHSAFYVLDQTGGISAWGDLSEGGYYVAPAEEPESVFDMSADLAIVQRGIVGKGVGQDSYIISSKLVQAQEQITITDTGENLIQFVEGLEVLSGKVAASALLLTLGNGAQLTVLDAQNYTYVVGGSALEDVAGDTYSFPEFVSSVLGSEVPLSGLETVAGSVIGGGVALEFGSVKQGEDTVVVQRGIIGKGAGADTYIVSNAPLDSGAEITLTDTGDNTLHLLDGLTIASSMVAANALMLTLENDTTLTVLGASEYSYTVGGDPIAGVAGVVLEYASFTEQVLGVSLPVGSTISTGGASTVRSGDIPGVEGAALLGSSVASNQVDYGFLRDAVTETFTLASVPDLASTSIEII